jgi:hypothetical protein
MFQWQTRLGELRRIGQTAASRHAAIPPGNPRRKSAAPFPGCHRPELDPSSTLMAPCASFYTTVIGRVAGVPSWA